MKDKNTDSAKIFIPSEEKNFKKSKTNNKKFVIICIVAVLIIVALFSPIFNIQEIVVSGNETIAEETIIRASGIIKGVNILKANLDTAKEYISSISYVDNVVIKRVFPSTVKIEIQESKEVAYIQFIGNYVGIDKTGKVLEIKQEGSELSYPLIYGFRLEEFKIGKTIKTDDNEKFNVLMKCVTELSKNDFLGNVHSIDLNDVEDVKFLLNNDVTVNVGKMDKFVYKMAFLKNMYDNLKEDRGGVVELSNPDNVTYRK